jgi:hypothetical protein
MKSKIIAMVVSFLIMIGITPLVFGKLMNAKFDKMLNNIEKKGIVLKEIKDKSTYLQTDRVFEVKIPGSKLNIPEIEYIKAIVEAKFKNLPVTTADFEGVVKEIKTKDFDNQKINEIIKDKIKFFVTTPNFRVYQYKIFDTNFDVNGLNLSLNGISGVFVYPNRNDLSIKKIKLYANDFEIKVLNFKNRYEKKLNEYLASNSFNLQGKIAGIGIDLKNFNSKNIVLVSGDKINSISDVKFKELNFGSLKIQNAKVDLKIKDLDKKLAITLNTANENEKDKILRDLVSKGFKVDLKLNIDKISYALKNLGFLNIDASVYVKPSKKLDNNLDFVNFDVTIATTPKLAAVVAIFEPKIAFVLQSAKEKDGKIIITIKKEDKEIFVNGKQIN